MTNLCKKEIPQSFGQVTDSWGVFEHETGTSLTPIELIVAPDTGPLYSFPLIEENIAPVSTRKLNLLPSINSSVSGKPPETGVNVLESFVKLGASSTTWGAFGGQPYAFIGFQTTGCPVCVFRASVWVWNVFWDWLSSEHLFLRSLIQCPSFPQ